MLRIHHHGKQGTRTWEAGEPLSRHTGWFDLVDPGPEERAAIESLVGVQLPKRDEINGLGLSGRHQDEGRVMLLHAHLYADHPHCPAEPLGMLVMEGQLVTVRYQPSRPFEHAVAAAQDAADPPSGSDLLVTLLEAIANDVAGHMQLIAADVARLSDDVFELRNEKTRELRKKMIRIGHLEGKLARYRTSMLGLGRVVGFVQHRPPEWMDEDAVVRIKVLASDLDVLDEFDDQLTGKLQFLQDGVLGFINTDQNAVMKLLTVASVVTIPPVILAGIWGMNFKYMPELDKIWGYPMALSALFVSMALPLAWFGLRGWLSRD